MLQDLGAYFSAEEVIKRSDNSIFVCFTHGRYEHIVLLNR